MSTTIPDNYRDLLDGPVVVALATVNPDGQPQVTPIWCNFDGTHILVNTARGRRKDKNMMERPKVTILAIDPENPYRWLEVRGEVQEANEEDALDHINALSKLYRGVEDYYSRNEAMRGKEQRVIYKIKPLKVNAAG